MANYTFGCPTCGVKELSEDCKRVNIRTENIRIDDVWYSHCLCCSGGVAKADDKFDESKHDPKLGLFPTKDGVVYVD